MPHHAATISLELRDVDFLLYCSYTPLVFVATVRRRARAPSPLQPSSSSSSSSQRWERKSSSCRRRRLRMLALRLDRRLTIGIMRLQVRSGRVYGGACAHFFASCARLQMPPPPPPTTIFTFAAARMTPRADARRGQTTAQRESCLSSVNHSLITCARSLTSALIGDVKRARARAISLACKRGKAAASENSDILGVATAAVAAAAATMTKGAHSWSTIASRR